MAEQRSLHKTFRIEKRNAHTSRKLDVGVLPCRIHHTGNVNASPRYWEPRDENDGTRTAFFRGRKLRGRVVHLPDGFSGLVINKINGVALEPRLGQEPTAEESVEAVDQDEDDEAREEEQDEVTTLAETASFDQITVWHHETLPDATEDVYSRGIDEWIRFAKAMHSY